MSCHSHSHSGSASGNKTHSHCHCGSACSCGCHSHCPSCHHEGDAGYAKQLLQIADEAWKEVVKEKIKEEIRKKSDAHLTQLAKVVADANQSHWVSKMQAHHAEHHSQETLNEAICSLAHNK